MVQLILGNKGKGKTKYLLDKVNNEVQRVSGNIAYLDKNVKHMYELNNKIRLINVTEYYITDIKEFLGFVCGIISQDHDLEQMYFDSFLTIAGLREKQSEVLIEEAIQKLEKISKRFNVDFVLSISLDVNEVSEALKSKVIVSL